MPKINTSPVTPKASPLPPVSTTDPLTPSQWRTLLALADTVIPSIVPETTANSSEELGVPETVYSSALTTIETTFHHGQTKELAREYLNERPSQIPAFRELIHRLFGTHLPTDVAKSLATSLTLLEYRASAFLLTGSPAPFSDQPVDVRQAILRSWSAAILPPIRLLFRSLTMLVKQNWAKTSPTIGPTLSFPRVPLHGTPSPGFAYSFLQLPPLPPTHQDEPEILDTDIVIVGSGCGGAVCGANLAAAGHRVLVTDKAFYWPPEHFPMTQSDAFIHMYMNGGGQFSDDASTLLVAAQTWGGGGTVNWSACLQTQGFVREEWSRGLGLDFFTSADFQASLDRVCGRMGAGTEAIEHNFGNRVLLEGARKLGWNAKAVPQNTGGKTHYCGYCTLGCGSCEKRGTVVSFLPDAAKAGAQFMEGFDCDKVLFEVDKGTGRKTATGVVGTWTSRDENGGVAGPPLVKRKVVIRAKRVIISAGTMQSPLILKRSGLKNAHIGKHLKLHPVNLVGAIYDEEIRPWEGGILTAVVSEFENMDGKGHGVKLESASMIPAFWLTSLFWRGGLEYKLLTPRMSHTVGHFALVRDTGEGEVYADPSDGRSRFRYHPSKKDKQHLLDGLLACAKINYIEGAKEIFCMIPGVSNFVRPDTGCENKGINCSHFNTWLDEVKKKGFPNPESFFVSAHQMGTCRMGKSAGYGVVDQKGKVWETEGLYVADASVFPSASGVNPMVTNMAIADWISTNLAKDLKTGGSERAKL